MQSFFRSCSDGLKGCAGKVKDTAVQCFNNVRESCNGENDINNNSEININNQNIVNEQNNNELNSSKKNNNKNYVDNKMFSLTVEGRTKRVDLLKEFNYKNYKNIQDAIVEKFNKIYFNYYVNEEEKSINFLIQKNKVLDKMANDLMKKHKEMQSDNYGGIKKLSEEVDDFCKQVEEERKNPDNIECNENNVLSKLNYLAYLKEDLCGKEVERINEVLESLIKIYKKEHLNVFFKLLIEDGKFWEDFYKEIQNNLSLLYKEMNMEYKIENCEEQQGEQLLSLANNLLIQTEKLCDELIEQYEELIKQNNRECQSLFEQRRIKRLNTSSLYDNKSIHGHSYQGNESFVSSKLNEPELNLDNKNKTNDLLNESFSHHNP